MTFSSRQKTPVYALLSLLAAIVIPSGAVTLSGEQAMFEQWVQQHQSESGLVAMAAIVMQDGQVLHSAASGERKKGSGVAVTLDDRWHIGSVTKSFTATLLARLEDQGKLSWDEPVVDQLGWGNGVHADWQTLTLHHLLTHTSGLPANFPIMMSFRTAPPEPGRPQARLDAVQKSLNKAPKTPPGTVFNYSNIGYTLAGVLAEQATGKSWESLIREEIFAPLGLGSGGFGPPQSPTGEVAEPRGHRRILGMTVTGAEDADNNAIIGPAGTLHLGLVDLARYGNEHLRGLLGEGELLNAAGYRRLHQAYLEDYAYGWVVQAPEPWDGGSVIWHNGSNTLWYTLLVLLPEQNSVIAAVFNDGNIGKADEVAWKLVRQSLSLLSHK